MKSLRLRTAPSTPGEPDRLLQAARAAAQAAEEATNELEPGAQIPQSDLKKLLNASQQITRQYRKKKGNR